MSSLTYKGGLILGILLVCGTFASSQWQEEPNVCYSCEGNDCATQSGPLNECSGEEQETCVTVFSENGESVIARGCSKKIADTHGDYCNRNSDKCQSCSSSHCNVATSLSEYVTCVVCDSKTDKNCVLSPNSITTTKLCYKSCMVALYARNVSDPSPTYELSRSCLDDKNLEAREKCSNGKDDLCKSCQGDKCNLQSLPENRFKCFKCDGENCEDPSSELCVTYNEADQCYFKFNELKDVIKLGCRSEFEPEDLLVQVTSKSVLLCDEPECNFFDKLPQNYHCKQCDSATDEECAIIPNNVAKSVQCSMPYSQCYSMVDGGRTIRGCINELVDDSFYHCLMNSSANCMTCTGENCNRDIYPVDRLRCHRCSSSDNVDCETQPSSSKVCSIYDKDDDSCVTKISKGITYRGCGSELTCGNLGNKNCQKCSGPDCNTAVLSDKPVGEPGIWQGLPINCYTCDGDQCASLNGPLRKCEDNDNQTCATIFDFNSKVVARGCSDDVEEKYGSYCDSHPDDCFQCKSSACNVAVSKTDYIDCIFCDSGANENCTFNPLNVIQTRKCLHDCMTALYPRTSDNDPSYNLIRTCLDDKDLDDRDACESDPHCQRCSDSKCNTHLIPEVRKTCNHCAGDSCQIPVSKSCNSYAVHEQCFIKFDETSTVVEMGCKSDYDPSDIQELLASKKLLLCDEDNCNIPENIPQTKSCRLCNSRTDRLCATDPQSVATTTSCNQIPITSCYTRILNDGHTERGCLSSLEGNQFLDCYNNNSTKCSICNESRCNDEVFPSDRRACHTCNSAEDSTCEVNPVHTEICLDYSPQQTCVTTFGEGITYRGCSSELSCAPNGTFTCRTCNTNSCNSVNLQRFSDINPGVWQTLPLNCYVCSGDDCQTSLTRLNMCNGDVYQHCMTVFGEDGVVTRRGCSEDVEEEFNEYCDKSVGKCFNCNSNGCNNATSIESYIECVYCDAMLNKDCVQDVAAVKIKRRCNTACMVSLKPRSVNENSLLELSRSCLDDKDLDDRELCGSDGSLCKRCISDNCNTEDVFEDRLECYTCSSGNCNSTVSKKCTTYLKDDNCFILFDGRNNIERKGCTSEFDDRELENNRDRIIKCSGKNCNDISLVPSPQTCIACDSSTDTRCASTPIDVTTESNCSSLPNVQCYVRVIYDGTTARGCVSDLSSYQRQECLSGNNDKCSICIGDRCNSEVFPEDRLSCHKCNSIDDPLCANQPNSPTVCPVYSESEVCATKLVNDQTYRGCGNDFTCDDSDKQYCKMCNTTNCNTANLYQNNIGYPGSWQDLPINCLTCVGSECDKNSSTLLRKCEDNNLQNCVTVFSVAGKVVQRGCSDAIYAGNYDHHCDNHPELCTYCKSSGCNDGNSLDEYVNCLFCDSATNPDCTSNVAGVSKTRKCKNKCMTSLYPRSDETDTAYELSRTCLDDKDLDGREECENGNDKFCKSCQGESCNKDKIPENRLSCYRCFGEDCDDPVQSTCPAYRENDKCFILFDDSNSIAQMGCRSDFENSTLTSLRKKMIFCDTDNCNNFDIIPESRKCLQCDSSKDPQCATSPSDLTNFTLCSNLPFTSCYMRIKDGHTKRGCMSELEIEDIDKCNTNGEDVKCEVCETEHCNVVLYPANRLTCQRCSSDSDENCETNPIETSACPLYQEDDQCVVNIFGSTTNRGCSSEINCDSEDRDTCRLCNSNNCNTIDLMSSYVGKPGQWQDLPLNCYTCKGTNCQNSVGKLKVCENNNIQKCVTVFDSTGKVEERGCSDLVAETNGDYCDTHSGSCLQCKSSGCNNVMSMADYIDCAFCDSTTNPNCVLNPTEGIKTRKCNKNCMVALYPRSSEDDPSFELVRTCLDDKDFDDRDNCANENDANCKSCSENNCNNVAFPEERHECLSCQGDACDDAKSQKCVSYHPSDQCYTLFDNSSSIIAMGCRSEYERSTVTDLIKAKSLLLCDGKNCNTYESIPNAQSCIVCNSAIDPQCATDPNLIINSTTCSQLPYTGCYTLINQDGDTERGCLSALESTAFYGCHTQSDAKCNTCTGNKCNLEVYPAGRISCHRCNSLDDGESCASSPRSNKICPKYVENQSCVTSYKDGVTQRGCSSELSCDISNKKTCRVCSESSCNTVDLEYVAKDGEPGKWQDLPIKCHTCKDDGCQSSLGSVEVCNDNNLQNCMTVFNDQGIVIQRGCSDDVIETQESYCEQNRDKCYRCNSNECNKANSVSDYVECLSCDSSINSACVTDPEDLKDTRKCYKSCMIALYPRSTEDDPAYDSLRSCLDDKELAAQQTCSSSSEHLCQACVDNKCNDGNWPDDRLTCYHCSGDSCQLPKAELCAGYRANDQCFLMIDKSNSIIEAGCKSLLTNDQAIALIKAKSIIFCEGKNCNEFNSLPKNQDCALCNSKTDPNCATSPNTLNSKTTCSQLPYTDCYTRVLSDGTTERGCLSSLEDNEFYDCLNNSTLCESCYGDQCNKLLYPPGRRSCHICDSGSDPNCDNSPNNESICPVYAANDVCVTLYTAGTTYRGCGTDLTCDASDRKKCRICEDTDNCNTVNLAQKQDDNFGKWQDLPLECYECEGNECSQPVGVAKKCENNNEQDCSTVFNSEGQVIRRGCSDKIENDLESYCDANPGLCFGCKSNGCNNATTLTEFTKCVSCDSNKEKTCVTNPTSITKTRQCQGPCMTALYPSDSSSNPAYDLIRTCLNDKESSDQNSCKGPLCNVCSDENCNIDDPPADRLRCYTCQNEDCETFVSELCPLYKEGDKCFIRFDSSNSVAEMGCLSAFRGQDVYDILKTKRVYICEGEDCNNPELLPQPNRCAVCDSALDVNCAINPTQIGSVGACNSMPYTDCSTKITSTGTTLRGCLADLSADDFASCILYGGDNCTHCVGPLCNRQIFPENRLQCYSCSSDTDPDCEHLPSTTSVCPYIRDSEKCVSAIDSSNITNRGCSSNLLCDTNDKSTCRPCSFSKCNNLIINGGDPNYGMWQELPLKCYNCSGDHCLHSIGPVVTCEDGDRQDCMTVFDQYGLVVRRGCTFDVEDGHDFYCWQNPEKCFSCKSNQCNDAWELSDYKTCVYCNSEIDASCVTNAMHGSFSTRKCQSCMAAAITATNGTTQVMRTCLDDKEMRDQHECSGEFESSSDCSSCSGELCNNFKYPKDRLTCNVCTGTSCQSPVEQDCAIYTKDDKCYAKYENGKIEQTGCSSDIDSTLLEQWREQNKLFDCEGDSCNALGNLPTEQTCVACDSSKNVECATNPSAIKETQLCIAPINSCMMNVTSTVTHRGCLNSLSFSQQNVCEEGNGSKVCGKCSGEKCNSKVYPSDRRSCFICSSDKDDDCKEGPTKKGVCPNYSQSNQCVVKYEGSITERGCSNDLTCDATDTDHCRYCVSDECNTVQLDNGVTTIIANNLLLTLLVAMISLMGVARKWF